MASRSKGSTDTVDMEQSFESYPTVEKTKPLNEGRPPLAQEHEQVQPQVPNIPDDQPFVPVAICGYAYRMPGGLEDDQAIWQMLSERGFVQEHIDQRYGRGTAPMDGYTDSPLRTASPYEGLIRDGRELEFDCALFGVSVNDAKRMDPQIKMMLTVTWEALQSAGLDQVALHNSNTGCFVGHQDSSRWGWRSPFGVTSTDMPGKTGSMIANRVSYHFNWMGPSFSVATACSSGITALDSAVKSLRLGECDVAAFGAVSYLGYLETSVSFNALGIISKTGGSRSFDKDANGYMRSEGAFMFILKRLTDAERDGDNIYGVIRGCALNTAGAELDANFLTQGRMILAPAGHAQASLMRSVSTMAGIKPTTVDYVECHATGTQVGDAVEGKAVASIYGSPERRTKLRLASSRSNFGHMEAASFTSSLLKVLLMLQRRQFLPVSSHFNKPNPKIPFEARRMQVQTVCEPFPDRPVIVGMNSFGFGGANGHCIVEEYRDPGPENWSRLPGETKGKIYMVPLSAKSEEALIEGARRLASRLEQLDGEIDAYTVAANLCVRTTHHRVRTAFAASTLPELQGQLTEFAARGDAGLLKSDEVCTIQLCRDTEDPSKVLSPAVVMVFPGQGSQWAGCGRQLYETEIVFRRAVDAIDREWVKLAGEKLSDFAFDVDVGQKLNECLLAQPVTFLLQVGLFEMLKAHGIHPDAVLGHSAGEVAAAYASGAYNLEDACYLVYNRSRLQHKLAGSGRMLVLMQDVVSVELTLCELGFLCNVPEGTEGDVVDVACFNSPSNTVVCGPDEVIARLQEKLAGSQKGKLIPGNIAFHSRWVTPIRDELLQVLEPLGEKVPAVPFISTVSGTLLDSFDANYWWENVRKPVDLISAIGVVRGHFLPDVIIELSPHITLRSPIRDCYNDDGVSLPTYVYTLVRNVKTAESFARAVGSCFRVGDMLGFKGLYPRPPPLSHLLPRYAMKEEKIMDDLVDDGALLKKETFSAGPLLGKHIQSEVKTYQSIFSKRHFSWMSDHVVQESIIPAAGYIELLLESFGGVPVRVINAKFLLPFILNEEARYLHTSIDPCVFAEEQYEFKISSRPHGDPDTVSIVHCTGTVEKLNEKSRRFALPASLPLSLGEDEGQYEETLYADSDSFYSTMSARVGEHYSYGPHFQSVSRVDRDIQSLRLRVEVSIDPNLWSKWDSMGYIFHPTLLDGALQVFLVYIMEAVDYVGVPQSLSFILLQKPTREKVICIYNPPEYLTKDTHQKGQLAFGLGERPAGTILIFDGETEELIAYVGDYTCFHSRSRKNELQKTKHYISWQPKDDCKASEVSISAVDILRNGGGVESAAKQLISDIVAGAHPEAGVPYFVNVGEYIIGTPPPKLALSECVESIKDSPVQYTVIASAQEIDYLTKIFKEFGTRYQEAHLRFALSTDAGEDGLLRSAMFELLIVRVAEVEDMVVSKEIESIGKLVSPGCLMLVDSANGPVELHASWGKIWSSPSSRSAKSTIMQIAPPVQAIDHTFESLQFSIVFDDTLGFSQCWRQHIGLAAATAADEPTNYQRAPKWRRVDYFAMKNAEDDSDLFDAPAALAECIREFALYRGIKISTKRCLFTVYTSGAVRDVSSPCQSGVWGAVRALAAELSGSCNVDFRLIDLQDKDDLRFIPVVEKMREREVCVHSQRIWIPRLINDRVPFTQAKLAANDNTAFRLETDDSGSLANLEFRTYHLSPLGPKDLEISVCSSALNFRDIMVGLGRLPLLSYERSALGRTVGMECSGEIVKCGSEVTKHQVGDKVIVMKGGCIANRIRCHEGLALGLPKNLSHEQGASVVSVYVTAYYSLLHLARIEEGMTILVHSAMGGVGQAAIALAKLQGAKVYGTAGSEAKRQKLLELGCLGAFDSHSTDWYHDLMIATNGRGVDVVLNSLAGSHVDLCLEALAAGGWHCEIGKVDIFQNRPLRMAVFRKNLTYRAVDIDRLLMDNPTLAMRMAARCLELLSEGKVPALPITVYPYKDYQNALNCMINGQHHGKLVLSLPLDGEKMTVTDSRPLFGVSSSALPGTCEQGEPRTVLLSGCMSGFGLRVLAYVVALGAQNVILLDRDPDRKRSVEYLKNHSYMNFTLRGGRCGTNIENVRMEIVHCDVSRYDHVVEAIETAERLGMPPIGSIFHLAGVLDDRKVEDLVYNSFKEVYAPKSNGAWNLHRATLKCKDIEHFIMFSSTSSIFGNIGQTNYSAANSFLDGLAEYRRRKLNRPALAFCMGAISETGMAARNTNVQQMMKANGLPAISCIFAIECLDAAIRASSHKSERFVGIKPGSVSNSVAALASDHFVADVGSTDFLRINGQLVRNTTAFKLSSNGNTLSKESIVDSVASKISALCGVEKAAISSTEPLASYGLNSISVAEVVTFLRQEMSYSVTPMELMTSATCESIAIGALDHAKTSDPNPRERRSNARSRGPMKRSSSILSTRSRTDDSEGPSSNRRSSLFAPSIGEHFGTSTHSRMSIRSGMLLENMSELGSNTSNDISDDEYDNAFEAHNPAMGLGEIDGSLPEECEETVDDLLGFIRSFDSSRIQAAVRSEDIESILLTGVTGFLGRHFLADLLKRKEASHIKLVYCPVRADSNEHAMQRVIEAMNEVGLWDEQFRERICPFAGNLADERFDIGDTQAELYSKLTSIDAVYHFASDLNLTAPYDKMRDSNCNSMRAVIRLCLTLKRKHLFLASTLGIFPQYFCQFSNEFAATTNSVSSNDSAIPHSSANNYLFPITHNAMPEMSAMKHVFPLVIGGYVWSKLVNEIACYTMARTKDIPLAVFRLPVMFVHGGTGYTVKGDPYVRFVQAFLQTGLIPGRVLPLVMEDADICCRMMLSISLNPDRKHVIYHCSQQSHRVFIESSYLDMFGYKLQTTSYEKFKTVSQELGVESPLHHYWMLYDHFSPYWFQSFKSLPQFPIDTRTTAEDMIDPMPEKPNGLDLLKLSRNWAFTHAENHKLWPYNVKLMEVNINLDTVLNSSRLLCKQYQVNFGDAVPQYVWNGLKRICEEIDVPNSAQPTVIFDITSKLETRVQLHRMFEMHPEILNEKIVQPIFIVGLNRTGTTFLHRMLCASDTVSAPKLEEQFLLPRAETMSKEFLVSPSVDSGGIANSSNIGVEHREYVNSMFNETIKAMEGIHEMKVGVPEEELGFYSHTFMSLEYDILYGLPKYRDWLLTLDMNDVYIEHRRWLQFISWWRRTRMNQPVERWCLKLPWHARSLDALTKQYPDAIIIHTHRPVSKVTGSWLSLVENQRSRFYNRIDIDRIQLGNEQMKTIKETIDSAMKFRTRNPDIESRWLDIYFDEIVNEPIETSMRVLHHGGILVTDDESNEPNNNKNSSMISDNDNNNNNVASSSSSSSITTSSSIVEGKIRQYVEKVTKERTPSKLHQYDLSDYGIDQAIFDNDDIFVSYREKHC